MNRKFFFEPIIFIKYDKTNDESLSAAELKLKKWDMLEISHRDDGLKYVILYSANTKEVLQRIIYSDSLETIESKIKLAIDQTENQFSSETHHK